MSVGTRGLLWRQFSEGRRLDVHNGRRTDGVTRHHTHSDQPVDCTNISVNPGLQVELSRMQPPSLESRWSGKPFRMVAGPRFRDTGDGSATQGGRT